MNRNRVLAIGVGLLLVLMLLMFSTTYSVKFHEVAVKTRFGANQAEPIRDPGVHFKLPIFADRVQTFDTRLQLLQSPTEELPTADGQSIIVQAFLLWKIDPEQALQFAGSFGSIESAEPQIQDRFRQAMAAVGQYNFDELIGDAHKLANVEADILANLSELQAQGVNPVKVGISQMLLPPKATGSVLRRMGATRKKLAEIERSKGSAEATEIIAKAGAQAEKIRAFAEQRAQEIRNLGTNQAAEYLTAMSEDEELAIFLVWLDTLKASLSDNLTAVLPIAYAPFHLLDLGSARSDGGVPQPEKSMFAEDTTSNPSGQAVAAADDDATNENDEDS